MPAPLRRSARIAALHARDAALHARNAANAAKATLGHSHEYRIALELLNRNKVADTEINRVETINAVFSWIVYHPQLLNEVPGFTRVVQEKATELHSHTIRSCNLLKERAYCSANIWYDDLLLFGAYNKLLVHIQMTLHLLKTMDA